jgi:general L-amino acid transport system permease protein
MPASLWYSEKARNWTTQVCLLLAYVALVAWLYDNTVTNLTARGIRVGWDFLWRQANFPISESVIDYDPSDTFFRAFVVGLTNTLFLSLIAIVLSTLLGLVVGLGRRSSNPLTSAVAGVYITAIRNTPLIVQLLFWYALATTALPGPRNALNPVAGIFISLRGVYLPRLQFEGDTNLLWAAAAVGAALLVAAIRYRRSHGWLTSRLISMGIVAYLTAAIVLAALAGVDASITLPELKGFNFVGGIRLSSEFSAIIVGLLIYTSAFIAEIIRGGIDAVGKGQWEAGRAIGLTERQTLSKIVVPQALRIIIPPMTTQYLSTVKNTTLALAVGYPELGLVVGTVINQTGQAIESILIMLAVFLLISLSVSLFMNWYNRKVALVRK